MKNRTKLGGSYAEFSAFGAYQSEFLGALTEKGIPLWDIRNTDGIITAKTKPRYYREAARTAKQFRTTTRIIGRGGYLFLLLRYKKRFGIICGIIMFWLVIAVLSNHVWDIRVTGNSGLSDGVINEILTDNNIVIGAHLHSFDTTMAEYDAILKLGELAWLNIERSGSRVNVKISERLIPEESAVPTDVPCNVIAERSGVIVSTKVLRGTQRAFKGSGVHEGDIMVSGVVDDGGGNNLYLHADAEIIAEYSETESFREDFTAARRVYGDSLEKNYLVFMGINIPLFIGGAPSEHTGFTVETRKCSIFGLPLPWKTATAKYTFYEDKEIVYSSEDTLKRLEDDIERYKENLFKNAELVDTKVSYFPDKTGITAKIICTVRKNIAKLQEISIKS